MIVGRENQILQLVYLAVLRKLPDILSTVSSRLINDGVRKPLRTGQPAPLNSFSCFCDGRFLHAFLQFI